MRTITQTVYLYSFGELSENSKQKVRDWYLTEMRTPEDFSYISNEQLKIDFFNSDLKLQYSLNHCQGDYLSINGKIYLTDILSWIKKYFTEKEIKFFDWAFKVYQPYYIIPDKYYTENLISDMEYDGLKNIPYKLLEKFDNYADGYISRLENQWAEWGYEYFYEVEDEEIEEWCKENNVEFFNDGKIAWED